ncbi:MAG: TolB family protein, partial [Gemmatimonadaceae bacterium]
MSISLRGVLRYALYGLLLGAAGAAGAAAHAQAAQPQPPGTDIYVARLLRQGSRLTLGPVRNVTRRPGYDNQPAFARDSRTLYYTSNRGDGQTDIWAVDVTGGRSRRVTRTRESEYSAAVTPDRTGLSVVRVEADSTQRLWRFPLGSGRPCLVLEHVKPVGYYAWADDSTVALFVLGRPASLQLARLDSRAVDTLAHDIGRSLHRVPGTGRVSFVDKADSAVWWIRSADPATRAVAAIAPLPTGVEDYTWTPRGELVASDGRSTVLVWEPRRATPNYA